MSNSLFIQIHTLTSYPGTLLNRDDVGFAKRLPFGGVTRTRVSSQCLKRHWRRHQGEHALSEIKGGEAAQMSVRSRSTFEEFVRKPLVAGGVEDEVARMVTEALMTEVLGKSAKAKAKKGEEAANETMKTGQITVFGRPELDYFLAEGRALSEAIKGSDDLSKALTQATKDRFNKEWIANLKALKLASGLDAALFGRMVTSDKLSRSDAAIHVAHALTVHGEETETDYFSAMDDLSAGGADGVEQLGSGHIGNTELTSGLFYSYVVVDVPLLLSNLEGVEQKDWRGADKSLAKEVLERLVQLMARVSPGAKLGSTAPYAYSHLVLAEVGAAQPRTLANAFLEPVRLNSNVLDGAFSKLSGYLEQVDGMYGKSEKRAFAAIGGDQLNSLGERKNLAEVGQFITQALEG